MDFDPQTQGLLAAAFQGLSASGPSRMPMSLGQIIGGAGKAGMNEYQQAMQMDQKKKQAEQLMLLEQQKELKEAAAVKMEAQMRAELATAKTPQEQLAIARKYMKPDTLGTSIASSLDRQSGQEATKEMAKARLSQSLQMAQNTHEARMRTLTDAKDRAAETARHNSVTEGLQRESLGITGQRLFYDTGLTSNSVIPNAPSGGGGLLSPSVTPGFKAVETLSTDGQQITNPAEIAAAKMVMDADSKGQPLTVGVPQSGLLSPVANAPASVIPAAPNNLDARDLAMRGAAPAAPVSAPVVAPKASAVPVMPPEIASAPRKVQDQWKIQQTRGSMAGAGTFTPETLEFTAKQYLKGDRQAAQGFARNSTARIALQNAIVDEAKKQGISPEETAAKMAEFAGTVAGSRTVGQRAANISLAATEANEMLDIVKETSDKFGRTNFVPWNYAIKAWDSGTGTPEIAALGASLNALVNVYARAINPTGVPTIADKDHAREVINAVQSPAQVDAVLGIIRRELDIAMRAPATVKAATRAGVVGDGEKKDAPAKIRKYNPATGKID